MSASTPATPREMRWIGTGVAAVGLYFMLVGLGLLPLPGGPSCLHGPLWLVLLAGLIFFLAGAAVLLQGIGRANANGELPPNAPQWMRVVQYVIGVAIFASFAMMGSWIAFGPGSRAFSGNFLFFDATTNEMIGRAMFGFGAIVCWLAAVGFAISGVRKILVRPKS